MSHNRIPIVCLVLLALTASAFIATQLSSGQGPKQDNPPLKMKVLRDKAHVKYSPGQSEIAAFRKTLPQETERQLVDLIPKHVPIKIKIKKEKEAGFKDLSNEKWSREFELEVTNTGTKPIYYLYFHVMTDVKAAAGFQIIFPLYYGRNELGEITTKAEPTDVPINPGETVSLKIHPNMLNAWDYKRKKENRPLPKRLEVKLQFLNFGDGTGYVGSGATALPRAIPEEGSSAACRPSFRNDAFGWNEAPPGSPLSKMLALNLPAAIWPVNFFPSSGFETNTSSASLFDTCCPGTYCSMLSRSIDETCYTCPPQTRVGLAICSNPDAACLEATFGTFECIPPKSELEPFECQTVDLNPCGSPTPSPTPTPSPSPTPTPTPCPYALPSECPGGVPRDPCTNPDPPPAPGATPNPNPDGCPFGYEVINGACCVPTACPQPTSAPPSCPENEISFFTGPPICQWSDCFELLPNPSPTPTPASATVEYQRNCVEYYWVWYVSYDGGKTWEPTGQVEYAGCYYV
jgi:hypothetical protein